MKKFISLIVVIGLLAGCNSSSDKKTSPPEESGAEELSCSFQVDTSSLAKMAQTSFQYSIECNANESQVFEMLENFN
jgi:hypothetical protein